MYAPQVSAIRLELVDEVRVVVTAGRIVIVDKPFDPEIAAT